MGFGDEWRAPPREVVAFRDGRHTVVPERQPERWVEVTIRALSDLPKNAIVDNVYLDKFKSQISVGAYLTCRCKNLTRPKKARPTCSP